MGSNAYDVIVVGVGAMGSSCCWHMAQSGLKVLGLEQFEIPHDKGSSHGETRLCRQAYFEHPDYVPLLKRAYDHWETLNDISSTPILEQTGLVLFEGPKGTLIEKAQKSAAKHSIATLRHQGEEALSQYPQFILPPDTVTLWEPRAGYLHVERAITLMAEEARKQGATLKTKETVLEWTSSEKGVTVRTPTDTYVAKKLVFTSGAWTQKLLPLLSSKLSVYRNVLCWFEAPPIYGQEFDCPCYGFSLGEDFVYGFPSIDTKLIKVAAHTPGERIDDPLKVDRELKPSDTAFLERFVAQHFKNVNPKPVKHAVCFYTMSPDEHFIIDHLPEDANVAFAAGFSGHGFKFASVVGEVLCDLITDKTPRAPVDFLKLSRFNEPQ